MISPLSGLHQSILSTNEPSPVSLESRLANQAQPEAEDGAIDQLYAEMKQRWEANPALSSNEIIDCLRNFVAADGSTPYKAIPTHMKALRAVMERLKEDGGEGSPAYAALYKGMGLAVVSNGIFNNFMIKMILQPETPEAW